MTVSKQELPMIIYSHPKRLVRFFGFGLLIVLVSIFLLAVEPRRPGTISIFLHKFLGGIGVVFGLAGCVLPFVLRKRPVITLTDDGLLWHEGTLIPWDDIVESEEYKISGNWGLTLSMRAGSDSYKKRPFVELGFAAATDEDFQLAKQIIENKIESNRLRGESHG